jgi:hypothetical protein
MKKRTFAVGLSALGFCIALATSGAQDAGKPVRPNYKTAEQIKAMPPCTGTVQGRAPCYVILNTPDGSGFRIGSPGNTPQIDGFVGFLKDGKSYKFPEAFLEYERSLPRYRMELVSVLDSEPRENMFVVVFLGGGFAFKSVEALKKFVGTLPQNSMLEWAPGCKRDGGEPLLSSEQDMSAFKELCREKRINFVLVPSG